MNRFLKYLAILILVSMLPANIFAQTGGAGTFRAVEYGQWRLQVTASGSNPANDGLAAGGGSYALSVANGGAVVAPGGNPGGGYFVPVAINVPITVGVGASQETVTPTAVSGCSPAYQSPVGCSITATFTYGHGPGTPIISGDAGLEEAINVAAGFNTYTAGATSSSYTAPVGGTVVVDRQWTAIGGTSALITAAVVFSNVSIMDTRNAAVEYWNPQGGLTTLAAPTTLTAVTALPSATPAGSYGTGTYYMCISYVDIMGQEGPCSATFSQAGLATGSFIFSAPAASPGAVGYTIYISLTSGSYVLAYKVPITSTICTLTSLETTTAACAVANTTYGQVGATATVTAITVNTSPIDPQVTTISTTSVYVPNAGGRTTYTYTPGSHVGTPGLVASYLPFTIGAAAATVVPAVIGTVDLPPGFMNFVGRTLEICGYATTTASAATIENIQFQWDAFGQNTAGKGVLIGNLTTTNTFATTGHIGFCEDFETTVAGASATAGSILDIGGYIVTTGVDLISTVSGGGNTLAATVGSLNLAAEARINVIYLHTTATDGAGFILQGLTAKVIN